MSPVVEETVDTVFVENGEYNTDIQKTKLDSLAIGNIHMNISKQQFEEETKVFFLQNDSIGNLKISHLYGHFYKDRLSALYVISEPTYKGHVGDWKNMYLREFNIRNSFFYGDNPNIYFWVEDGLSDCKPFEDIQNIVKHKYVVLNYDYKEDLDKYMDKLKCKGPMGGLLMDELFKETQKAIELQANDPGFQARKKRYEDKVKNLPTWSMIIIYFDRLVNQEIEEIKNKEEKEYEDEFQKTSNLINPNKK